MPLEVSRLFPEPKDDAAPLNRAQRAALRHAYKREREERAADAHERHYALRAAQDLETRRARAQLTLGHRCDAALLAATKLSGAAGSPTERTNRGKPGSTPPPPVEGPLFGQGEAVHDFFARRIGLLIGSLEREVDAHLVRPVTAERGDTTEAIDRRLVEQFEGLSPAEVVFLDPVWSRRAPRNPVRAVERAREKHGRNPRTGEAVQEVRRDQAARGLQQG